MRKCRCCRQSWPLDCYNRVSGKTNGKTYRRRQCAACQYHCGAARRRRAVETTRTWRARLRADVAAVRAARAA